MCFSEHSGFVRQMRLLLLAGCLLQACGAQLVALKDNGLLHYGSPSDASLSLAAAGEILSRTLGLVSFHLLLLHGNVSRLMLVL